MTNHDLMMLGVYGVVGGGLVGSVVNAVANGWFSTDSSLRIEQESDPVQFLGVLVLHLFGVAFAIAGCGHALGLNADPMAWVQRWLPFMAGPAL